MGEDNIPLYMSQWTKQFALFMLQIYVSRKWGFTKWDKEKYEEMRADGRLVPDGVGVQYKPNKGPLAKWMAAQQA